MMEGDNNKLYKDEHVLYLSDVVYNENNSLGVIIEMPDSDTDDDTDDEGLPKEHAMVSWYPSGEEELLEQRDLKLKSRMLDPGMGVERTGDPRHGVLLDVAASCTVKLVGTDVKVSNVPGALLTPWNLHYHEPNVVLGSWLGYILQLQQTLVVGLKNGARVLMKFDTARHMEDSKFSEISPFYSGTWYVGQKLEGKSRWIKRATLLSGTMPAFKPKAKVKGVVLEAILSGIEVEWIMHGFTNSNKKTETPPPSLITGDLLSKIRVFDRYQQRFLTVGLPALLKMPARYNLQTILQEIENNGGRLPDLDIEQSESETPSHHCSTNNTDSTSLTKDNVTSDNDPSCAGLMFETKIDDKTSAEVQKVEEKAEVEGKKKVQHEDEDTTAETEDETEEDEEEEEEDEEEEEEEEDDEEEDDEDLSSESDSGLDDTLEHDKNKSLDQTVEDETKPQLPEIRQEIQQPEPTQTDKSDRIRFNKRTPKSSRAGGWSSKIAPKGPVEVKNQYLVEILAADYSGKVLWEDGTQESVPCTELTQIEHLDEHAHMPGYFVNKVNSPEELAVVVKYSSEDRTCLVYWLESKQVEEDVSVYSLEFNRKYDFNPMDIIVCLSDCNHSTIGQIVYVTDKGKLLVHWSDGTESEIKPSNCVHALSSDYEDQSMDEDDWAEADDESSLSEGWMTADSDFFSEHDFDESGEHLIPKEEYCEETEEIKAEESAEESNHPVSHSETCEASKTVSPRKKSRSLRHDDDTPVTTTTPVSSGAGTISPGVEEASTPSGDATHTSSDSNDNTRARKRFKNGRNPLTQSLGLPGEEPSAQELSLVMAEHSKIISESFKMLPRCPETHHFHGYSQPGSYQRSFLNAVRKDIKLISSSLPKGIWVRAFEDRMDLLSCLIEGPTDTPYEGVLFVFDIQLPSTYSSSPPLMHYVSYSTTKLNPNLYPDGKVCLSLLGTWMGKGTEQWTKSSNLLQLFVSIQSLVLNASPYYNEAGFNKYRETQSGAYNAKLFNEMVVFKILEHVTAMFTTPHKAFEREIRSYYFVSVPKTIDRYNHLIECSKAGKSETADITYPLLPLSKGVIPCIKSLLTPLKIFTCVESVYNSNNDQTTEDVLVLSKINETINETGKETIQEPLNETEEIGQKKETPSPEEQYDNPTVSSCGNHVHDGSLNLDKRGFPNGDNPTSIETIVDNQTNTDTLSDQNKSPNQTIMS